MPNDAMRDKQRGLGDGRPSEWNLHDGDDPDEALRGLEQALGQMDACVRAQREGGGSLLQASRATFESLPKAQACLAVLANLYYLASPPFVMLYAPAEIFGTVYGLLIALCGLLQIVIVALGLCQRKG